MEKTEYQTIIRRNVGSLEWEIWSNVPRDVRRLKKCAVSYGAEVIQESSNAISVRGLPVRAILFREKPQKKRSSAAVRDVTLKPRAI